jgi:predicted dehydrogenase
MNPGRKYRIGVIGAGARAEAFTKPLYEGTDRAELFGICDIDEDRLKKFVGFLGHEKARLFTDPREFFAQKEMDAVVVTVPEFAHKDVAIQAMNAGKHIYLEKAMARTGAECREIIQAHRASGVIAFLGFNLRAAVLYMKVREIVDSGVLGQIVHIAALEQLGQAHSASFMRRFHRRRKNSGGFLNTKCSHDMDILQWMVGHKHRVRRVASFGGLNVFLPKKAPAKFCHECPRDIYNKCPYKDQPGFVFPCFGPAPIHKTRDLDVYGGDLCVYNDDKDLIDNQTVIMEWDNGVRGNFNLQLFQHEGLRSIRIFGEDGLLEASTSLDAVKVTRSTSGEVISHGLAHRKGGHGGADPMMLGRFIDAIESGGKTDSGLAQGLAATLLAEKADESMMTGKVVEIKPEEFE